MRYLSDDERYQCQAGHDWWLVNRTLPGTALDLSLPQPGELTGADSDDPAERALALLTQAARAARQAHEAAGGDPQAFEPVWHPRDIPPGVTSAKDLALVTRLHRRTATTEELDHLRGLSTRHDSSMFASFGPGVAWSPWLQSPFSDAFEDSDEPGTDDDVAPPPHRLTGRMLAGPK